MEHELTFQKIKEQVELPELLSHCGYTLKKGEDLGRDKILVFEGNDTLAAYSASRILWLRTGSDGRHHLPAAPERRLALLGCVAGPLFAQNRRFGCCRGNSLDVGDTMPAYMVSEALRRALVVCRPPAGLIVHSALSDAAASSWAART
ncbi:hypothetical protein [Hymenobacter rigui]|uniref:Uncharacterized protein n=1 Tax=Hymenobacter rigui TaxID=334424 RepID=A0A428KM23_9BACT|nr:hypothetical protein [Hymenobacter rigui]RSK47501.1 hypothetical protein EI291_14680 [Hymenobacter rigui]